MKQLTDLFDRFLTGWVVLSALTLFIFFSVLALPKQGALAEKYSQGLGSPDTSLFYTGAKLFEMAETYGSEGRLAYLHARWNFDLAFPLIYTLFFLTSIHWLFKNTTQTRSRSWLLVLPLLAFLLDLAENIATSVVMRAFPAQVVWGQTLAPVFTPLKWFAVAGSALLVGVGLMRWLILSIKRN